jgi:hypothetical protein
MMLYDAHRPGPEQHNRAVEQRLPIGLTPATATT